RGGGGGGGGASLSWPRTRDGGRHLARRPSMTAPARRGAGNEEGGSGANGMSKEGAEGRAGVAFEARIARVGLRPDPAGTIWKDGSFWSDCWREAPADGPLPEGPVIVSKRRWLADREALAASGAPLGLRLEPGEALDELAGELARFQLIALSFPTYSDGRPSSTARLLREKCGCGGELRGVGNVPNDQTPFMRRVGFDTLAVTHEPTRRALVEKRIAQVTLHYQPTGVSEPTAGKRPWLRRTPA